MNKPFQNLEIYELSRKLVITCYELARELPPEESTNFSRYIRTSALGFHLQIAQGIFLKTKKRKKFLNKAKNSLIIIDAALEMLVEVGYARRDQVETAGRLTSSCYQLIDQL